MKKYFSFLCAALVLAGILVSCSDEDQENGKKGVAGRTINCSVSGKSSRTVYDDKDPLLLQINWEDGEQIKIFCEEEENDKKAV